VYLDFAKAFDRVPHKRLIAKLKSLGISGNLLRWCESFLCNRTQRVVMGEFIGDWKNIGSGVPQGSVLGPLFFIIYINDLLMSLTIPNCTYADDTKLISINDSPTQSIILQQNLDIVFSWTEIWLLFLNINKCKILHFGNPKQLSEKSIFHINQVTIAESFEEKDLGVIITPDLNWDKQIVKVCSQATLISKKLHRCFKNKSIDIIKKLYTSLIRPKLEYANVIWYPQTIKHSKMLENIQKRWTRIGDLSHLKYSDRLKQLGLTTLAVRRIRGDLIQIFKYFKGIDQFILLKSPVSHNIRTRGHCYKLAFEHCNHSSRSNFLFNRVNQIWNSLPPALLLACSVNEFKNRLDEINLDHYCI
jgi:hypothetical protein